MTQHNKKIKVNKTLKYTGIIMINVIINSNEMHKWLKFIPLKYNFNSI